jgi:protein-L-isoaspartate(D-aspartate) O-methyltransferase
MRAVPRDLFLERIADGAYREEALLDTPLRIEELDFNVSAPHMHGTCLESLSLSPGQTVLDVGAGCGLLTAAMAHIVGPRGFVGGIEIRKQCLALCKDNMRRLHVCNPSFKAQSAPIKFELTNVFILPPHHVGKYDRVHVGACCPPDKVAPLLRLLRPEGGLIVVPVSPSDLRVIKMKSDGKISQQVVTQVRFSDLVVPTDAEILLATLRAERKARTAPVAIPSTYVEDIQDLNITVPVLRISSIAADGNDGRRTTPESFPLSSPPPPPTSLLTKRKGALHASSSSSPSPSPRSPSGVIGGFPCSLGSHHNSGRSSLDSWPARLGKLLTSCSPTKGKGNDESDPSSSSSKEGSPSLARGESSSRSAIAKNKVDPSLLGKADMMLVGAGWHIPTHMSLLRRRCEHLKARHNSGMRDALSSIVAVPDHFSQLTMHAFVHYIYYDEVPAAILQDPESVVALLHAAQYYGTPRLTQICELSLSQIITAKKPRSSTSSDSADKSKDMKEKEKTKKKMRKNKEAQHSDDEDTSNGDASLMMMMMDVDPSPAAGSDGGMNLHHDDAYCKNEAAASLLGLADEQGLPHLRSVSLDYVVHNYDEVSKTDAFKALSKEQLEMVAGEACKLLSEMTAAMKRMIEAAGEELPQPTY